jgi:hypothetical protein
VIDSFPVAIEPKYQYFPALACGTGNQTLITYSGWTDYINSHPANTMRIWGKFYPFVGIEERSTLNALSAFGGLKIYPNPAKSVLCVRYPSSVKDMKIYNITGRLVKSFTTVSDKRTAVNEIHWDGIDDSGKKLPAGVYLLRLETLKGTTETKELIILR